MAFWLDRLRQAVRQRQGRVLKPAWGNPGNESKNKMRAESPCQILEHDMASPNRYLSNAMNRAVGARERLGGVTIPGAMPQADIKRAFGPRLITPQSLGTRSPTISPSPTFNHTRRTRIGILIVTEKRMTRTALEESFHLVLRR